MTVYDYIAALRYTEIQSTIVNGVAIEFDRITDEGMMHVTSLFTGEVLVTFNVNNEVTYASDLIWLTSKYIVPTNNEYIETYTKYIPDMDVTVIFQDTWASIDNHVELCQSDVTGYYYGEPSEDLTNMYNGMYIRK
jgi:hypothetical protein